LFDRFKCISYLKANENITKLRIRQCDDKSKKDKMKNREELITAIFDEAGKAILKICLKQKKHS
jgi:hypothetical protein